MGGRAVSASSERGHLKGYASFDRAPARGFLVRRPRTSTAGSHGIQSGLACDPAGLGLDEMAAYGMSVCVTDEVRIRIADTSPQSVELDFPEGRGYPRLAMRLYEARA